MNNYLILVYSRTSIFVVSAHPLISPHNFNHSISDTCPGFHEIDEDESDYLDIDSD